MTTDELVDELIHMYDSKSFARRWTTDSQTRVRLICTRQYTDLSTVHAYSVHTKVTCPRCLEILYTKSQALAGDLQHRLHIALQKQLEESCP